MFNNRKDAHAPVSESATTLIAEGTHIRGDIHFSGRLHIDGKIEGAVHGEGDQAILTLSEHAVVTGEVHAPHIVIDGTINGDVDATGRLELASNARVEGNVYYKLLEMSAGARINGKMVHRDEPQKQLPKPDIDTPPEAEKA
ncbi:MAG TPA: polymer-forming cytoskeletal protein [Rudaea sp.]|jgi:cytoskeletal protein CcmA (bactofilin family)|nr:polymer-forming cytoskeletal protein [Rudaea sp.]